MRVGDVVLYHGGNNWISRVIKRVTRSEYSHVGVYVGDGFVAEAQLNGFVYTHKFDPKDYEGVNVYRLKKDKRFKKSVFREVVNNYIGRRYGFLDLIRIFIFTYTGLKTSRRSKGMICSEAVAQVYRDLGVDLFPGRNLDFVTPACFGRLKSLKRVRFD